MTNPKPKRPIRDPGQWRSKRRLLGVDGVCERCRKAPTQRRVWWGGRSQYFCEECSTVVARERDRAFDAAPTNNIMVQNRAAGVAEIAQRFLEHQLQAFQVQDAVIYAVLEISRMRVGAVAVKHLLAPRPKGEGAMKWRPWMETRVMVRGDLAYPFSERLPVRAVQVKNQVDRALIGRDWFFEYEEIVFRDAAEAFVYGAGYGLFKILRKLNLVPGRAAKTSMRRYGIEWLQAFRVWRAQQPGAAPVAPFLTAQTA